jgi:hypothetical protein
MTTTAFVRLPNSFVVFSFNEQLRSSYDKIEV